MLKREKQNKPELTEGVIVEVQSIETGQYHSGKIIKNDPNGNLFKIDFGNNKIEDAVHINRIKPTKGVNQWTKEKDRALKIMVAKLKFNREITRFYYYRISREEGYWAWTLILISTFTSTLSLGNNVDIEPFAHYFKLLGFAITLMSTVTTLIAAWMKKQRYLDRINNCDRYLQKINTIIEQIDLILIHDPHDRMTYGEFNEKIYPNIQSLSTTPPISPEEQKYCIYQITVNYPEIIMCDGDRDNKLWPWFDIYIDNHSHPRITSYGESVIRSYIREERARQRTSIRSCFGCFLPHQDTLISKYYTYMNLQPTFKTQEHLFKIGSIVLLQSEFFNKLKQHRQSVNCDIILGEIIKRYDRNNYRIKLITHDQSTFEYLKTHRLLYFDIEDTMIIEILDDEKRERLYTSVEMKKERTYNNKAKLITNRNRTVIKNNHLQQHVEQKQSTPVKSDKPQLKTHTATNVNEQENIVIEIASVENEKNKVLECDTSNNSIV
jgi:hypothetical protein